MHKLPASANASFLYFVSFKLFSLVYTKHMYKTNICREYIYDVKDQ